MAAKTIALLMLVGVLSVPLWAQGQTCTQIPTWFISGSAGCPAPSQGWIDSMQYSQATFGGTGPNCTYRPLPNGNCSYGDCNSTGWTCKPTSKPVSGPTCPDCGGPVSLANGNVFIQQTDIRMPGLGGGLTLTRSWNSTWPCDYLCQPGGGIFGTGWRSTYEESVSPSPDGSMMVYSRSDGSMWSFAFYGSPGVFHLIAPTNVPPVTLTEQGTTTPTWTITFENGEQRVFNGLSGGPLSAIIDRNGNTTTLTYANIGTSSIPLIALTTVTDAAGGHLYFNYPGPTSSGAVIGLVSSVTSDSGTGINVQYTYAMDSAWLFGASMGPAAVLTQVTQSDNTFVNFNYDFSLNITSVTDMNGIVLESHQYVGGGCNAGLTSSRASGFEALTVAFSGINSYCSFGGVGYPSSDAQ